MQNDIFDIEVTKGESCCFYVWSFGHFDAKISLNLHFLYLYLACTWISLLLAFIIKWYELDNAHCFAFSSFWIQIIAILNQISQILPKHTYRSNCNSTLITVEQSWNTVVSTGIVWWNLWNLIQNWQNAMKF